MDFELFVYLMLHTHVPKYIFFSIHKKSIFSLKLKLRSVLMETLLNMPKSINGLWTICVPNVAYPCARILFFFNSQKINFFPKTQTSFSVDRNPPKYAQKH